ncbi:hypothetical protein AQUCO_01300570v1 [Aquilegia coerulea]|uniref:DUF8040 domain-containing protein n=1 Tax=Aquilegia coerulea TaxID=218851 RepID=A0A2G5E318_AQUCA|nr:hypothetical protein AQUCO_01300570v1 [Aquilegia coerulea]
MMDDSDNEDIVGMTVESVAENSPTCQYENRLLRQPCQGSLHFGSTYVSRVLNGDNAYCNEKFRVNKQVFYKLCDILQTKGLLCHTNAMRIEEQLAIFLFRIGNDQVKDLVVQELFQRSGKEINHYFRSVLTAILKVAKYIIREPSEDDTPEEIMNNPELFPYFMNCMGTIEITYLPIKVDVEQTRFCNRKGLISQKVMGACSFDFQFHYILAGWEGAASDLQVLMSALDNKFLIPKGTMHFYDTSIYFGTYLLTYSKGDH